MGRVKEMLCPTGCTYDDFDIYYDVNFYTDELTTYLEYDEAQEYDEQERSMSSMQE